MDVCIPIQSFFAGTLLVAVLAVFVFPVFAIPDTTLSAKSLAQLVFLALIALAVSPAGSLPDRISVGRVSRDNCSPIFAPSVNLAPPLLG
jgi:hypothetical protein